MKHTPKRALSLFLALVCVFALYAPAASAAAADFDFTITANGGVSATVAVNGKVTVKLTVVNNAVGSGATYDLYSLQDYVCFDRAYFSLDKSSISVMKVTVLNQEKNLFQTAALSFDGGDPDRVFVNRASMTAQSVARSIDVLSFTLTALKTGTTTITNDTVEMLSQSGERYSVQKTGATVTIGTGGGDTPSGGGDTPSGGGGSGGSQPEVKAPVIIDGKEYSIGKTEVSGNTTTVIVDHDQLAEQMKSASTTVRVPVTSNTATSAAQLVVSDVEAMSEKNMSLIIDLGDVSYSIPTTAINTDTISRQYPNVASKDILFTVTISDASGSQSAAVSSAVVTAGGELVLPPLSFTVTAEYGGKSVEVEVFSEYTARIISITEEQAKKITTAVVYEKDGTLRHVPTCVYQDGGKWYAKVNSLTNSTYALIYNDASFTDAVGTWYVDIVSEMASRKIINGVGGGLFEGDRSITRAEFAAIVIRALGLPQNGTSSFSDVPASAWYAGAVGQAYQYGIINGRSAAVFDPLAAITREEAMAIVARASAVAQLKGQESTDISRFRDSSEVSAWAVAYVQYNVANGLIVGNENAELKPVSNISRAETATVILRLLQNAGLVDVRAKA